MAYFNHAFRQTHLGTSVANTNDSLSDGFIYKSGISTAALSMTTSSDPNLNYGPGTFGFFDPKTNLSVSDSFDTCCPLYLASASVMSKDQLGAGAFHGGYLESVKSKLINPKYIHKVYQVNSCVPQQSVISIGNTPGTIGAGVATLTITNNGGGAYITGNYTDVLLTNLSATGNGMTADITVDGGGNVTVVTPVNPGDGYNINDTLTITGLGGDDSAYITVNTLTSLDPNNFQGGTTQSNCCFTFLCGETYYLRIDIKGSPTLRFLNHQAYQNIYAYTGCCPADAPTTLVDSTLVMITWAKAVITNAYLKPFVMPVVYDEAGIAWYAPGTTVTLDGLATAVTSAQWWDAYVSPGHVNDKCAGMRLFGAYVETKFGNCSFQVTDFYEKEPVQLYASLVDYNGDPCVFEGICVYNDCHGVQGMGFGETVVRDLILFQSYLQNFFSSDQRIREITQGTDILNSVNRNALYTRYFILHTVPRYNNPTGVFDNDQYLVEIVTTNRITELETFLDGWAINSCQSGCDVREVNSCNHCVIAPDFAG